MRSVTRATLVVVAALLGQLIGCAAPPRVPFHTLPALEGRVCALEVDGRLQILMRGGPDNETVTYYRDQTTDPMGNVVVTREVELSFDGEGRLEEVAVAAEGRIERYTWHRDPRGELETVVWAAAGYREPFGALHVRQLDEEGRLRRELTRSSSRDALAAPLDWAEDSFPAPHADVWEEERTWTRDESGRVVAATHRRAPAHGAGVVRELVYRYEDEALLGWSVEERNHDGATTRYEVVLEPGPEVPQLDDAPPAHVELPSPERLLERWGGGGLESQPPGWEADTRVDLVDAGAGRIVAARRERPDGQVERLAWERDAQDRIIGWSLYIESAKPNVMAGVLARASTTCGAPSFVYRDHPQLP